MNAEEITLAMCGALDRRFDFDSKECIYCAHGLKYNELLRCVGLPGVIEKCYGNHHYHAKTQECMYCAKGYIFHCKKRNCTEDQVKKQEMKKI